MKKTMVSLAAASLIATTAMAADKGIDIVTTGQAVIYYETQNDNGKDLATGKDESSLFSDKSSAANIGLQLNLDADLKNNFTFGSQLTYLGTAGLEKSLVTDTKQDAAGWDGTTSEIALTKIFVAKKIDNTTVKIGRQELPKSLSPFAYSEGWNVFKNTFDAVLVVNTDIPDTTLVGAYVAGGTDIMDLNDNRNLTPKASHVDGTTSVDGTAYMLTVQNKSIPMTTITASYYSVGKITNDSVALAGVNLEGADALWADVAIASKDLPMGLKVGLQGGTIMTDSSALKDTTAFGIRAGINPIDALTLCAAFTSVDGDDTKPSVAIKNFGTGVKSPLYTQMTYNQDAISLDADTFMLKAAYNTGDYGTIIAQGSMTSAGKANLMNDDRAKDTDYNEFNLIYKVKAAGVEYFAAYIYRDWSEKTVAGSDLEDQDKDHRVRAWARYNF